MSDIVNSSTYIFYDGVINKRRNIFTRVVYNTSIPAFNNYVLVQFEEGLPQLSDEVFDGSEPSLIVVDDHMSDIN